MVTDGRALHAAVRINSLTIVRWLLQHGADPLVDNADNMVSLHLAGRPPLARSVILYMPRH